MNRETMGRIRRVSKLLAFILGITIVPIMLGKIHFLDDRDKNGNITVPPHSGFATYIEGLLTTIIFSVILFVVIMLCMCTYNYIMNGEFRP